MIKHTLREYIEILKGYGLTDHELPEGGISDRTVELVSYDSRDVVPGTLFICKGVHFDEKYLTDAVKKGAFCYISLNEYPCAGIPCVKVNDIRYACGALAAFYYDNPSGNLCITGITGTKGKTTTAYYIKSVLDEYLKSLGGNESGILSSVDTYDGAERFESNLTTPEPLELERHLSNAVSSGIKYMTMEVSSQGLKYHRVFGVNFSVACFLNIADCDHISPLEHPDFEDYFASKLKIFDRCRVAVVNSDSDHLAEIMEAAKKAEKIITFSEKDPKADVYGSNARTGEETTIFHAVTKDFDGEFRLSMPGLFNVSNALACMAVCQAYGIPEQFIHAGLSKAKVAGRMETYTTSDRHIIAIVDFAHNALSFEKLFQYVQETYPAKRIVTVFGSGGNKSLNRRHDLGRIAGKYAAHTYLCEDNPRDEDPMDICREIARAVAEEGGEYSIVLERGDAIRTAVRESTESTVVVVGGRGAETWIRRGARCVSLPSDVEYVKEALHDYDAGHIDT